MTELLPCAHRCGCRRPNPCRAEHQCVVLNFFLATCVNSTPPTTSAQPLRVGLRVTFSDRHPCTLCVPRGHVRLCNGSSDPSTWHLSPVPSRSIRPRARFLARFLERQDSSIHHRAQLWGFSVNFVRERPHITAPRTRISACPSFPPRKPGGNSIRRLRVVLSYYARADRQDDTRRLGREIYTGSRETL